MLVPNVGGSIMVYCIIRTTNGKDGQFASSRTAFDFPASDDP